MVGRELTNVYPPKTNVPGDAVLRVESLSSMYQNLKEVSFELRKGEILGVAGLMGAGRTEMLSNLFGLATRKGGKVIKGGAELKDKSPRKAMRNGFAMVTEERRSNGIFYVLNIRENATIANLKKYLKFKLYIRDKMIAEDTDWAIKAMAIKTASQRTKIGTLSGGNQQKVIFGRCLLTDPDILLLDEPTRGIDVGAKYDIYQLMIDLAKEGKAVVMVSSELPELLGVCDRILVMSGGRLAGAVEAAKATQEEIMTLAAKYA
jgi:methyl-galactoside transport system ATP-binding protein